MSAAAPAAVAPDAPAPASPPAPAAPAPAPPTVDGEGAGGVEPSVPRDTTPTWELELLVSGAVLFGLFQVPPLVITAYTSYRPHLGILGIALATPAVLLTLSLFYVLIGCFVLHLLLRAYWVALVGAHSVFPHGVRWEKQREYGPFQSRMQQERVRPLPHFIARADNAASLVFASGFVLAATSMGGIGLLVPQALLLWAFVRALGTERGLLAAALVYLPLTLALAAAPLVDLKYGERIDPASRAGRALRAVLRISHGTVPRGVRSMGSVLTSNVPKRVAYVAALVASAGAIATAFAHVGPWNDALPSAGAYAFFDDAAPGASLPAVRYESLRGGAAASDRAPSIDRDVVTEPYVRLFIPYRPARHDEALAGACPGLRPLAFDDPYTPAARAAADAALRCAERVHGVRLDGRPLDALRFRFLADPRTNRRGFVAYVPVATLPPGEHRLTVASVSLGARVAAQPYEIPFWK